MTIKVLGSGCKNCQTLKQNARLALDNLNLKGEIIAVTEYPEMMQYGISNTPALVINEKVVSAGRVLSANEIEKFLAVN